MGYIFKFFIPINYVDFKKNFLPKLFDLGTNFQGTYIMCLESLRANDSKVLILFR